MGESLVYRFENCLKILNLFICDLGFTAILLSTTTNSTKGVEKGGVRQLGETFAWCKSGYLTERDENIRIPFALSRRFCRS